MVSTNELITQRFDSTEEYADNAIEQANDQMAALTALLDSLIVPALDDIEDIEFPEILPIDYDARPSFTGQLATFPTFTNAVPAAPILADVPDGSTIVAPSLIDLTDPGTLSHAEGAYNSDMRTDLFAKILYDMRHGGTGLDPTVEADIYDRGRERQRVENERLYRETEDRFSATGFSLPTGALASSLQSVGEEISRKIDQLNIEITIGQADLEQKNIQFTVTQATQIEGLLTEFYNNQENRSFEISKAIAQSAIDVFTTLIANQNLKLDKYKTEADVQNIQTDSVVKTNEMLIKKYEADLKVYTAELEMEIKNAQLQVEAFKTEAMVFEVESNATGMEYTAKIQEASLRIERVRLELQKQIAIIEATKGGYIALKSLQEKGLEGVMNANAQLAASAMNAVNVSAGQTHGYTDSNQLSESHNHSYKEK